MFGFTYQDQPYRQEAGRNGAHVDTHTGIAGFTSRWLESIRAPARIRGPESFRAIVDDLPVNVVTCCLADLRINYANKAALAEIRNIGPFAGVEPDQVVGSSVDIFDQEPGHIRHLLSNPGKLPYEARIELGEHLHDLRVTALTDADGGTRTAMLIWTNVTSRVRLVEQFERDVLATIDQIAVAATETEASVGQMGCSARSGAQQALAASTGAEQSATNMQTVSAATEQMASSVHEISRRVSESASRAGEAVAEAGRANDKVRTMSDAAETIGSIVDLITDIAAKTDLLALNAAIEAARAGPAGRGFSVVATEVKALAKQTTRATEKISAVVGNIRNSTQDSVSAIESIVALIDRISQNSIGIASAVEEQGAAIEEISRNIHQAAIGDQDSLGNIRSMGEAVSETENMASEVLESSGALSLKIQKLASEAGGFLKKFRLV